MTEHLAFDELEAIDLSFPLSIAPRGGGSGAVSFQRGGESFHGGHAGYSGLGKPVRQLSLGRADVCLLAGVGGAHESDEIEDGEERWHCVDAVAGGFRVLLV